MSYNFSRSRTSFISQNKSTLPLKSNPNDYLPRNDSRASKRYPDPNVLSPKINTREDELDKLKQIVQENIKYFNKIDNKINNLTEIFFQLQTRDNKRDECLYKILEKVEKCECGGKLSKQIIESLNENTSAINKLGNQFSSLKNTLDNIESYRIPILAPRDNQFDHNSIKTKQPILPNKQNYTKLIEPQSRSTTSSKDTEISRRSRSYENNTTNKLNPVSPGKAESNNREFNSPELKTRVDSSRNTQINRGNSIKEPGNTSQYGKELKGDLTIKPYSSVPSTSGHRSPRNDDISVISTESCLTPLGLQNPAGYCYLNSAIQILRGCKDFVNYIIAYHKNDTRVQSKANKDELSLFMDDICKLFYELNSPKNARIPDRIKKIQYYFNNASHGDDIMQTFMRILTKIHQVVNDKKNVERMGSLRDISADEAFAKYQSNNKGFVFDLFYGQMSQEFYCNSCHTQIRKSFQLYKTISLPVPKSNKTVPITDCFKLFLEPSSVILETDLTKMQNFTCRCPNNSRQKIVSIMKLTHGPKYLFVYLNRGSYYADDIKNNTFIECDGTLNLPMDQPSYYQLVSVVDHIGNNNDGHYFVKSCLESKQWFSLNDTHVRKIDNKDIDIITKNTIVFLFKKMV